MQVLLAGLFGAYGWQGEQGEKGEQAVRARAKELRDQGIGWAMSYDQALKEAEKYGEISPLQSFISREVTDPIEAITPGIGISKAIRAGSKQALDVAKKQVAKQIPEQAKITGPFRGDIDQIKSDITTNSPDLEDIRGQKNAKSLLAAKEKEIHDRVETIFMDRFDTKTGAPKELAEEDALILIITLVKIYLNLSRHLKSMSQMFVLLLGLLSRLLSLNLYYQGNLGVPSLDIILGEINISLHLIVI